MITTLMINEGTKAKILTDNAIELSRGDSKILITFSTAKEVEELEETLYALGKVLRNKEWRAIGKYNCLECGDDLKTGKEKDRQICNKCIKRNFYNE